MVSSIRFDSRRKWSQYFCGQQDSDHVETGISTEKDGRVKWKDSGCIRVTKMQWVSMEKQLNSTGRMPKKSRITQ